MKDNKGFISISIIYSFFFVFIAIIVGLLVQYISNRTLLNRIKEDARDIVNESMISGFAKTLISAYGGVPAIKVLDDASLMSVTQDNEFGMYKKQDNYGTSYYYRGDVNNNYVQFGSYTDEVTFTVYGGDSIVIPSNSKMYWRIVRINGDGTIRLVYDGTQLVENGTKYFPFIGSGVYNKNSGSLEYLGYTFDDGNGNQTDSEAKLYIENWYENYLKDNYENYIADTIFCVNRDVTTDLTEESGYEHYLYGEDNKLICDNLNDKYTVNNATGNGYLKYPVGLLTEDEIVLAGGKSNDWTTSNGVHYLQSNNYEWTMSPYGFADDSCCLYGACVYVKGIKGYAMHLDNVSYMKLNYRPVINLRADVAFSGTGTIDDPYVIGE